ncbi:hypothetical protein AF335_18905 [Streptomyces eurocidicus]|uniref:Flavin reductase (DIM6/NTAB) family NADH-FMN oxidoreductase RutF n=1 Tax=Streptomyces eurocidicus TaxID=66423 RepID=A0A2N8NUZ2_STREU|nr:flavin reductase family protein [Streptomyces eurocidicus]MBB5122431.1 flavin reductase (DIM6/NTAB) family NADH-FMN oxidoreductase RutF [Streptomyces eurocidicus]PNE32605.1 hypothetical protein AF335_18905 [Streptomyces eurocidicus]
MNSVYAAAPELGTEACRSLYRKLAAGVTVVTTCGLDGEPQGLTASSVTTLSLRPPMMLVCLATTSGTLTAIRTRRAFAIHLLRAEQTALAAAFAGSSGSGKFAGVEFQWALGIPVLPGTLGWATCALADERRYGDHSVVVGSVISVSDGRGEPLIWHDRRFRELAARGRRDAFAEN